MPDQTIELIREQAERCKLDRMSDVLVARFRRGQDEYGDTNHLQPWTDHALEGIQERLDSWIYLVLQRRRGADIEQGRINSAAMQLRVEVDWLPKCDDPLRFFISGPYTAIGEDAVHDHVERAAQMKAALMRRGHYTYCPHMESAFFEEDYSDITRKMHLDNCIAQLDPSEAIMMLPNWARSEGAITEHGIMVSRGRPVYDDILQVPVYWQGVQMMWATEAATSA